MKRMRLAVTIILAVIYLILGNVVGIRSAGMEHSYPGSIEVFFAPYTFIAGMSSFAGWDKLSFVFEAIVFALTLPAFYTVTVLSSHIGRYFRITKSSGQNNTTEIK